MIGSHFTACLHSSRNTVRDIDIANPSVCLSVRDVLVLYKNDCRNFSSSDSAIILIFWQLITVTKFVRSHPNGGIEGVGTNKVGMKIFAIFTETVRDRNKVTMEDHYKIVHVCRLSHHMVADDLDWHLKVISSIVVDCHNMHICLYLTLVARSPLTLSIPYSQNIARSYKVMYLLVNKQILMSWKQCNLESLLLLIINRNLWCRSNHLVFDDFRRPCRSFHRFNCESSVIAKCITVALAIWLDTSIGTKTSSKQSLHNIVVIMTMLMNWRWLLLIQWRCRISWRRCMKASVTCHTESCYSWLQRRRPLALWQLEVTSTPAPLTPRWYVTPRRTNWFSSWKRDMNDRLTHTCTRTLTVHSSLPILRYSTASVDW